MITNQVEEVKNKTDIVSLISEYIEVKKAGRNYKANCPFHGEKTPSFMISPEIQSFKCFGCGASGDIFTFLERHEGMEFSEALKYLADKAGVRLNFVKTNETSDREKIININKSALNFYEFILNSHPQGKRILEYLTKDRGLKLETIKKFKIGYSPEDYDTFAKYLKTKKKFNENDLKLTGLLVGRGIDRFRARVIFPLFDHRDNCIGFAGRILPWAKQDNAKYINSPDTPAYHKSKVLYGLNVTKGDIRNKKFAVVVEGELDMISSYQAGIKNVIAIKGSALTEDQIRLIGRFAQRIVLCLDADFAGDEASKRGAILAINAGFEVKVATLKNAKDPDEASRNNPEEYKRSIEEAVDIWEFLINLVFGKHDSGTGTGKANISKEIIPLLNLIQDKIVQSFYVEKVARKLSVPVEAVTGEIARVSKNKVQETFNDSNLIENINKTRRQLLEEKLLVNALSGDHKLLEENKDLFSESIIIKIIDNLKKFLEKNYKVELSTFSSFLPKELSTFFAEVVLNNSEKEDIDELIKELTTLSLKEKMDSLGKEIRDFEAKGDNKNVSKYQKEYTELAKKLSTL